MKLNDHIEAVIIREGEFIDLPDDRGGPTRYGISEIIARSQGYLGSVRDLPRDTAIEIYERIYWRRPKLAAVHDCAPHLAYRLFNLCVDVGPATAIGFLRRGLNALNRNCDEAENIPPTPIVDTNLIATLTAYLRRHPREGEAVLVKAINALQGAQYVTLAEQRPADKIFIFDWINNRID